MWSYGAIKPRWSIEIASGDNDGAKLWILWRHVKIKKNQIVYHKSFTLTIMSYFSVFLSQIIQSLQKDGQEIKISTRMKKFNFGVKYAVFIKNEMNFWKLLIFATHGLKTILISVPNLRTIW